MHLIAPLSAIEVDGSLVPIIAISAVFICWIVAMLVRHQQKMAELIHSRQPDGQIEERVRSIEDRLEQLEERVTAQVLAVEDLRASLRE
ncbi:MAG: hypothetical protein AB1725_02395 [Armatimonadota bacterium]